MKHVYASFLILFLFEGLGQLFGGMTFEAKDYKPRPSLESHMIVAQEGTDPAGYSVSG